MMSNRFKFTQAKVRELPAAPEGTTTMYHDTKVHFLKCRVTDKGSKSYIISAKIHGKSVKKVVGRIRGNEMDPSVETIRIRAREIYQELEAEGGRTKMKSAPTFGEFFAVWAESAEMLAHSEDWRESKIVAAKKYCAPIMGLRLDDIGRAEIREIMTALQKQNKPGPLRMVRIIVKQLFELALDNGVLPEEHPIPIPRGLKPQRNKRERVLSKVELPRFISALMEFPGHKNLDAGSFRLIVFLALFTGQRKGNILTMCWDEIDNSQGVWVIPKGKTKSRREYRIGLHPFVLALLQEQRKRLLASGKSSPYVFPSFSSLQRPIYNVKRPWALLLKEAKIVDFRFHDLRHTAATMAFNVLQDVKSIQLFLQHKDLRTSGNVYINTSDMGPQVRSSEAVISGVLEAIELDQAGFSDKVFYAG